MTNYKFNKDYNFNKKSEYDKALNKFLYEIKFRKQEYIKECVKYDTDFSSKIKKIYFELILDKFTIYLTRSEKESLVSNLLINDLYVNYLELCNINSNEEYIYQDSFLTHLNFLKDQNELKHVNLNSSQISKIVDITPLQLLNYELSEENFIIKISKKLFDFLVINSNKTDLKEVFQKLFSQHDFDTDNFFTIGELGSCLNYSKINIDDFDLRYLFETAFKVENGRISRTALYDFIIEYSSKNYNNLAKTNFENDLSKTEDREENQLFKIVQNNYLIGIIRDSLQILGKMFLLKYYAKYYEISNNKFFIDSVWLELGLKKFGYKDVPPGDMGSFKFLCVKKSFGVLKNEMTIKIEIEKLFDFIIQEFNIKDDKKDSSETIEIFSGHLLQNIREDINSDIFGNGRNQLNEFEFRQKLNKKFKFVDHSMFDTLVDSLSENSRSKKFTSDIKQDLDNNIFKLENVSKNKWTSFQMNLIFMSFIKNCDELGIMLDLPEIVQLKNIYNNMETKLFPTKLISEKTIKNIKVGDSNFVFYDDIPKPNSLNKNNTFEFKSDLSSNSTNVREIVDNNFNSELFSSNNFKRKEFSQIDRKVPPVISNSITSNYKSENLNKFNINETIDVIPELYKLCTGYIAKQFGLEKIDNKILFKVGCCKIFRDNLIDKKINIINDVNLSVFIHEIKSIPGVSDKILGFLEYYANQFKKINNMIDLNLLFSKLEEIILQYNKIIDKN